MSGSQLRASTRPAAIKKQWLDQNDPKTFFKALNNLEKEMLQEQAGVTIDLVVNGKTLVFVNGRLKQVL